MLTPSPRQPTLQVKPALYEGVTLKTASAYLFLCLGIVLVFASCETTEPEPKDEDKGDPGMVALPELACSYEFQEGVMDSTFFRLETSFYFSEELESFGGLRARISGNWTIGSYEIVSEIGGVVFRDTTGMFSWASLHLTPADNPGKCLEAILRFSGDGEYMRTDDFLHCCPGCYATSEDLLGHEIMAELVIKKSSPPTSMTIVGVSGEITEIHIEVIQPVFVE